MSGVVVIPIDLIKYIVDLEPILVGKIACTMCSLRDHYTPLMNEFKLKLLRPGGKVYSSYQVLPNGAKHLLYTKYYSDRVSIAFTVNYINGLKQGEKRKYNSNNRLYSIVNYVDGKKHGMCESYAENGMVFKRKHYVDGKKHGKCIGWWQGQVTDIQEYVNGKEHGQTIIYFERNVVVCDWVNGKKCGKMYRYEYTGEIVGCKEYKNNKLDGIHTIYHKNGNIETQINYVDGVIVDNEVKTYYPDGLIKMVRYYDKGVEVLHRRRTFYPSGKIEKQGALNDTKTSSNYIKFNEDGKVASKIMFKNDKPILYQYYDNGETRYKEKINSDIEWAC
ncbi:MORN repeat-containing protein [Faustovirus ST1]|nr:MORN repeat-containing protein [Faustovirus ST1]